jgi:transcriptional regulator with XRE-family HTH domain
MENPGDTDTNAQRRSGPDVPGLRRAAGEWLRSLREQRGLSQRDLAKLVDADYYTFISQLETGRGKVPPERYEIWANALAIDPKTFVKKLLHYYDPLTYEILFQEDVRDEVVANRHGTAVDAMTSGASQKGL